VVEVGGQRHKALAVKELLQQTIILQTILDNIMVHCMKRELREIPKVINTRFKVL
jgi:hypothetical protein